MLLAGDEFRRTQRGNNNASCQDNETSWVDWSLAERLALDTTQPSLGDWDAADRDMGVVNGTLYAVGSRSCAILVATVPDP
jgi:hypothetical protein